MPNQLSPELLAQLMAQESEDPFLVLATLTHTSFAEPIYLVNNSEDIVSNGITFSAFPFRLRLPPDDGEKAREAQIEFDNVSLELIELIRSVTTRIDIKLEMVLASVPDDIQYSLEELKISNISYNRSTIVASLIMDDFLHGGLTSERYTPTNFPGLF